MIKIFQKHIEFCHLYGANNQMCYTYQFTKSRQILGAKLSITRNPHSIRSSCCLQVTRKPFYTFARRLWSLVNIELYWAPARHCQGLKQFCSWNVHNMKFYTLYFSLKYWPVTYVQWTLSISEFVLSWYQQNSWAAQLTVIERSAHTTWRRNTESLVFGLLWQSEGVLRSFTQADQAPVQLSQPKKLWDLMQILCLLTQEKCSPRCSGANKVIFLPPNILSWFKNFFFL